MDHGLSITRRDSSPVTTEYLKPNTARPEIGTVPTDPTRPGIPRVERPSRAWDEALNRTGRDIQSAKSAVAQLADLLANIRVGIRLNGDGPQAAVANERLISSAVATAKDIIEHAASNGTKLFSGAAAGSGAAARQAVSAYASSQLAFEEEIDRLRPPQVGQLLGDLTEDMVGEKGLLSRLQWLAEAPPDGLSTIQALSSLELALGQMMDVLESAMNEHVERPRAISARGGGHSGLPLDLSA